MPDPSNTQTADPFTEGGGYPEGIKFPTVGDIVVMTVRKVDKKIDVDMETNLPKAWPNGDPMHVFVFVGEVDGEPRSLWVRGHMVSAIREAVEAAGTGTVIDTKLTLKLDSLGTPKKKGWNPPKLFKAKVEKVAAAPAADPFSDDEEPF